MVNRMNRTRYTGACEGCNNFSAPRANNSAPTCDANKNKLMKRLQTVDFSLVDTVLYLDAYPHCKKALDYYHKLLAERESILASLASMGVPTTSFGNTSDTWVWTNSPWPWEYEANV